VIREVKEELGLESVITRFIGHYVFGEMNQIILAFAVRASGEIRTNSELAETRLMPVAQLRYYDFGPLYITTAVVRDWLTPA
jgi:NAD+ diphosphatase